MRLLGQLRSGETTRSLVRLLASRQVSSQTLTRAIPFLQQFWLSNTQVADIEDSGQALTNQHGATRLLLPVLRAQAVGERRWCGWCWALTPDHRTATYRCAQGAESTGTAVMRKGNRTWCARKKHWKVGGHRSECAALALAGSSIGVAEEAEGDGDGIPEGKGEDAGSGSSVGGARGSGRGGGGRKKKGKKGRR